MNLSRFAFRNSRGILLSALFASLLGVLAFVQMPAAILPDFPYPRLAIIVRAGDLAIEDVLVRVTRPLEAASSGVPGAKIVRSKTARGSVEMSIDFDWGTDMFQAYTRLNAFVASTRSQLPPGVDVQVEWINPSVFPIIGISLTSDRSPVRDLRDEALLTVAPYLSRLPGVYRANVVGGEVREYQVLVDPHALVAQNITLPQVNRALAASNFIQGVGRFTRQGQSYMVIVDAQVPRPEAVLDMVVDARGAHLVRVRDIATVREGDQELTRLVAANGREGVQVDVLKQPGASTAQVSAAVRQALRQLQEQLPAGTRVHLFYDEAILLHESQASLVDSIIVGGALAMLVLLVALRSWRSMSIVLLCLPITILLAFFCLKQLGQTLNIMTLGGLAVGLGLIIDDVVVTLENIYRHLEMGKPAREAALEGAFEIQKPMIGSTLTTVAVFLPLAFLGGLTGALYSPLSITLTILLLVSVLLAVTFVPVVCALFLRPLSRRTTNYRPEDTRPAAIDEAFNTSPHPTARGPDHPATSPGAFSRFLRGALATPWAVITGAALLAVCGAAAFRQLPSGLMPKMDEGAFVLDYQAGAGTPMEVTDRLCRLVEQVVMTTPEVDGYCRRTGLELGLFATDPNRGDFMVKLKPRNERRRDMNQVIEEVMSRCEERVPGLKFEAFPPLADRVGDIAGEPSPIEVKIFGEDPKQLEELAEKVSRVVNSVPGVKEGAHEITPGGPELTVRIDPQRAGLLGLTPQEVAGTLELAMFGRVETYARRGDRLIGLRALFPKELRRTEEQIRRLPVYAKNGRVVTLEQVADVREDPGIFEVVRENQKQVIPVKAVLAPGNTDLGGANREVQRRVREQVRLPAGYSVQYGGLYYTQQEAFRNLGLVLLLVLGLVFIATVFQYDRFAEPFALLVAGAFALAGVTLALLLTGTPLNLASWTGAIMIFGMVMTNGIVLMDTIRAQSAAGLPLEDAIIRGGELRLRPVLMTASIAVLTLLPLAFGIGSGAEMQRPLAIAVIGGLATSPLFTLVLAPTILYLCRRGKPGADVSE